MAYEAVPAAAYGVYAAYPAAPQAAYGVSYAAPAAPAYVCGPDGCYVVAPPTYAVAPPAAPPEPPRKKPSVFLGAFATSASEMPDAE